MDNSAGIVSSQEFIDCLYFNVMNLAHEFERIAYKAFKPTGLSASLALLLLAIIKNPEITPKKISNFFNLAPSTVTRFLDKLEKQNYISRTYKKKNTFVRALQKAFKIEKSLRNCWSTLYSELKEFIGADKYKEFLDFLNPK